MQDLRDLKEISLLNQNQWNQPNINMILIHATAIGFLKEYGLEKDFKINIEVNHATLSSTYIST